MNRKKSETSKSIRELIVNCYKKGKSYGEIAQLVNRSKSTIHYIVKKFNTQSNIVNKPCCGRSKKLTEREKRTIIRKIRQNSFTSGTQLA